MQWKRIWKSKGFYIACALQVFCYLYAHMDAGTFWHSPIEYFGSADILYFYLMPRSFGLCGFLLPMVAALPAAGQISEDCQSGFLRYVIHRVGRIHYIRIRMAQSFVAGFLASLAGSLIYLIAIMILCPWNDCILESWRYVLAQGAFRVLAEKAYGFPLIADGICRLAFAAGVWGLFAFGIMCLTERENAGAALTFLIYDALSAVLGSNEITGEWAPAEIAVPWIDYSGSLADPGIRQLIYLAAALIFCGAAARFFIKRQEG